MCTATVLMGWKYNEWCEHTENTKVGEVNVAVSLML